MVAERETRNFDKNGGVENRDYDLIHDLGKRLEALSRYEQYIAHARGNSALQDFWRSLKKQELENVKRFKEFVAGHRGKSCF